MSPLREAVEAERAYYEQQRREVQRLTQALRVIDDRLARWLLLPTGTRLADLRQYVAEVLEACDER